MIPPPRAHNFSAGPAALPLPVLERIKREIVDSGNTGISLLESSHRGKLYATAHNASIASTRRVLGIPSNYEVIVLGGGATLQFCMAPLNLLSGGTADIAISGSWAKKAYADMINSSVIPPNSARIIFDGSDKQFSHLPEPRELDINPRAAYLHITSNETINGLQWKSFPEIEHVPIVADMSSDIASRVIDIKKFGAIYASAQKNIGPSGATLIIIRSDLLKRCPDTLPSYLNYRRHADANSLYNTPPIFAVIALGMVMEWIENRGGLAAMEKTNSQKAAILYGAIDESGGVYRNSIAKPFRSMMNAVFHISDERLYAPFLDEATKQGFIGLRGHRSVGGCRASLYNAVPLSSVELLAQFMRQFAREHA